MTSDFLSSIYKDVTEAKKVACVYKFLLRNDKEAKIHKTRKNKKNQQARGTKLK